MDTRLVAGVIAAFAASSAIVGAEQPRPHFQVPEKESAKAEELANQLAKLSRRVDLNEAKLLADCAYATVARLRPVYNMNKGGERPEVTNHPEVPPSPQHHITPPVAPSLPVTSPNEEN